SPLRDVYKRQVPHRCAMCKRGGRCAPFAHAVRGRSPPLRSWDRWGRPLRARLVRAVRGPGCGM
ncbi:hypothetical protein, partial [Streptomyces sp. rh206]|uniref:hypothetical protein n=1 Tax=Streptomyces sp. rh206 TaxID=2034270 RepID=UPI001C54E21C